jgi:uncharacterized protein
MASPTEKGREPAIEGWFTIDESAPALLGSKCTVCGTYVFPPAKLGCPNPDCVSDSFETVELSRNGRIWSYTDARYEPPPPYVAAKPFAPFCLAAVELAHEKIVVLGQVVDGYTVDDLHVGMEVELVLGALNPEVPDSDGPADGSAKATDAGDAGDAKNDAAGVEKIIWKWRPVKDA